MTTGNPAIFLDRDNTLIHDPGYINSPEQVRLYDDVGDSLGRLQRAGYKLVIVTNQSGIARGLITEDQLAAVHGRLAELLSASGCTLEAIYSCPYLDGAEAKVAAYRQASDLRKPEPGMLLQAAEDLDIDLPRSWMIGDSARDIEAGRRAGCRTILLQRGGAVEETGVAMADHVVASLQEAAQIVLNHAGQKPAAPEPAPVTQSPSSTEANEPKSADVLQVVQQIRDQLDRLSRVNRQEDFSIQRLLGSLLQMLAAVAAAWGLWGIFTDQPEEAAARLCLAVFFQVASLSCSFTGK
jgi:D,D-heptose 1,7-bisphosphate phosphatase